MNKNESISPSQQSEFEVILSEQDYERLKNVSTRYNEALEANKILTQQLQSFRTNTHNKDHEVRQLTSKIMKMVQRVIYLEQINVQLQQKNDLLKKRLFQALQQSSRFKQELTQTNDTLKKTILKSQQIKGQIQRLQIELEKTRQMHVKQQELKQELQMKVNQMIQKHAKQQQLKHGLSSEITRLSQQLQKQASTNQQMIAMYRQSSDQNTHMNQFITRLSDQVTKMNSLIEINEKEEEVDEQSEKICKQEKQQKGNEGKDQQKYKSIMISEYSKLQFVEDSLICISNTLQSHFKKLKELNSLQQLNNNLENSNSVLSKRMQFIQNRSNNLQQQLCSELNIRKVIQNKYEGIRLMVGNKQLVNDAMEDMIKKYHEAIDNQYVILMDKLFDE